MERGRSVQEEVTALRPARGPKLWPFTFALAILLWLYTTTGGRQVFVNEMLSEAFDSQAEHFLRGNVDVDGEAIRHEAMIVRGHARMYFGPFPALLRIPLNAIWPSARGKWGRVSGCLAVSVALAAFARLVGRALERSDVSWRAARFVGITSLIGFALASPLLLLLGNMSIYNEAVIWGLAGAVAALSFAYAAINARPRVATWELFGFAASTAVALLSRATFGAPLLVVALALAVPLLRQRAWRDLLVVALPIALALFGYALLSYARFGTFLGVSYSHYINPTHREFARSHGTFDFARVPFALADYFTLRLPRIDSVSPFVHAQRHRLAHGAIFSLPFSETYVSVLWSSLWLIAAAAVGAFTLSRRNAAMLFDRIVIAAFLGEALLILAYFALAQRYAAELYPLLFALLIIALRYNGKIFARFRYAFTALVLMCAALNFFATIAWLTDADLNVPRPTRDAWRALLRVKP